MKFCLKLFLFLIFFYLVENYEKSKAFFLDATSKLKKVTFPKTLPISSLGNFTEFRDFQTVMLRIMVDRVQSKDLFHLIDANKDKIIQGYEWDDFYSLFITPFIKCDTNADLFLNISEGTNCIKEGEKFRNLVAFSSGLTDDIQSFLVRIINTFDLDRDGKLNLYDYVILRNFNNAYDILLVKEQKLYFKNFEVGLHMISKNLKFYEHEDFVRIFNRTLGSAYLSHNENLDFATFSTIGVFLKLFINNKYNTGGYLTYSDLISIGQYQQTYKLLQNYTSLFIKNDITYQSLNKGIKLNNIIFIDSLNNTISNIDLIKGNIKRISIEHLFLLYRTYDTFYTHNKVFPFTITFENFEDFISDKLYTKFKKLIIQSFPEFQKATSAAGQKFEMKDYMRFIFNSLDINHSAYLEVYELLLGLKVCSLFNSLKVEGKIINNNNQTMSIFKSLQNYNDVNILTLDRSDTEYLVYINYKFNKSSLNFHQFLFIYLNRLRDTSKYVLPIDIKSFLNSHGFYFKEEDLLEFYRYYDIKPDDFLNFNLAIQKYFEFYSNNM